MPPIIGIFRSRIEGEVLQALGIAPDSILKAAKPQKLAVILKHKKILKMIKFAETMKSPLSLALSKLARSLLYITYIYTRARFYVA